MTFPLLLHSFDNRSFPIRTDSSVDVLFRYPHLLSDGQRRRLLISRHQVNMNSHPSQSINRLSRLRFHRVGQRNHAGEHVVDGDEDARSTERFFAGFETLLRRRKRDVRIGEKGFVSDGDVMSSRNAIVGERWEFSGDLTANSQSGNAFECFDFDSCR